MSSSAKREEQRQQSGRPRIIILDGELKSALHGKDDFWNAATVVTDVGELLRSLLTDVPDALVLNEHSHNHSSLALVRSLRDDPRLTALPILIVATDELVAARQLAGLDLVDTVSQPISWPLAQLRVTHLLERARLQFELLETRRNNAALIESIPDSIYVLDAAGVVTAEISRKGLATDDPKQLVVGAHLATSLPGEVSNHVRDQVKKVCRSGAAHTFEYRALGVDFETRLVRREGGDILAFIRDISPRKRAEAKIHHLAYHDPLTSLPNRLYFNRALQAAVDDGLSNGTKFGVLYIDLDRFKRINDTFGHALGDNLLKTVALRLKGCIREGDYASHSTLARLGGDEFVMIASAEESALEAIAERFQEALRTPFVHDTHRFVVSPSIGIAIFPDDGESPLELLRNADAAMYRVKVEGRNGFRFYSSTQRIRSLERLDLEHDLRRAIPNGELRVVYQPKFDLETQTIIGAEALVRWHHPERGCIPPTEFIPLAEESTLILDIGDWVLEEVCRQIKAWSTLPQKLSVSLNASSQQFRFVDFAQHVVDAIKSHDIEPSRLEVEITESLLMRNRETVIEQLHTLRKIGIRLSIDDFGTGYSSLSYLKDFPIHALKIDRSFVSELHTSSNDAAICTAIIAMAKELGLTVIAEGVETEEQMTFLRRHGCHQIQGYLIAKPMPPDEFLRMLSGRDSAMIEHDD